MGGVIDLSSWRETRAGRAGDRLGDAVARLDDLLETLGWRDRRAPDWLVTEVLAVQGCLALGLDEPAASRAERLAEKLERAAERSRARRTRAHARG
jgi:hypothetical protein